MLTIWMSTTSDDITMYPLWSPVLRAKQDVWQMPCNTKHPGMLWKALTLPTHWSCIFLVLTHRYMNESWFVNVSDASHIIWYTFCCDLLMISVIIGSGNGLLDVQHRVDTGAKADIVPIGTLNTISCGVWTNISKSLFMKLHLQMVSVIKCHLFPSHASQCQCIQRNLCSILIEIIIEKMTRWNKHL